MGSIRKRTYPDGRVRWMVDYVDARGVRRREIIKARKNGEEIAPKVLERREAEVYLASHDGLFREIIREEVRELLTQRRKRQRQRRIPSDTEARWRILIAAGRPIECEVCKAIDPAILDVDHINGISTDDRPENLRVVCANDHAKTHRSGHTLMNLLPAPSLDGVGERLAAYRNASLAAAKSTTPE